MLLALTAMAGVMRGVWARLPATLPSHNTDIASHCQVDTLLSLQLVLLSNLWFEGNVPDVWWLSASIVHVVVYENGKRNMNIPFWIISIFDMLVCIVECMLAGHVLFSVCTIIMWVFAELELKWSTTCCKGKLLVSCPRGCPRLGKDDLLLMGRLSDHSQWINSYHLAITPAPIVRKDKLSVSGSLESKVWKSWQGGNICRHYPILWPDIGLTVVLCRGWMWEVSGQQSDIGSSGSATNNYWEHQSICINKGRGNIGEWGYNE